MAKLRETGGSWLLWTPTAGSLPAVRYVTEWGAGRIICIAPPAGSPPPPEAAAVQEAVAQAGKQSARAAPPDLVFCAGLAEALAQVGQAGRDLYVLDELQEGPGLAAASRAVSADRVALLVGPRSGFRDSDRVLFGRMTPPPRHVSLGPRLFSPDAAACAAVALVQQLGGLRPES